MSTGNLFLRFRRLGSPRRQQTAPGEPGPSSSEGGEGRLGSLMKRATLLPREGQPSGPPNSSTLGSREVTASSVGADFQPRAGEARRPWLQDRCYPGTPTLLDPARDGVLDVVGQVCGLEEGGVLLLQAATFSTLTISTV